MKTVTIIFGLILIAIGVLGFVPQALKGDLLLGIFKIDPLHNFIHLGSGIFALVSAFHSLYATRLYYQIFGITYALVAVLGFYFNHHDIFGVLANNRADTFLHIGIAAFSLYMGFIVKLNEQ